MIDFSAFRSRLLVSGELEMRTPLHLGAGRAASPVDPDLPVVKDVRGNPYIPGSSLKGAIRSHVSSLLMAFQQGGTVDLACDQDYEGWRGGTACVSVSDVNTWRQQSPAQLDNLITGQLCLACRVLGSPWMASKVKIQDAPVRPDTWHRYIIRDGVAIDRDKGTAADGFKYDYEVVPAGARFDFRMQVDNASPEELGVVAVAIQALQEEQILVGGAHRAGVGWCRLVVGPGGLKLYDSPESLLLQTPADFDLKAAVKGIVQHLQ